MQPAVGGAEIFHFQALIKLHFCLSCVCERFNDVSHYIESANISEGHWAGFSEQARFFVNEEYGMYSGDSGGEEQPGGSINGIKVLSFAGEPFSTVLTIALIVRHSAEHPGPSFYHNEWNCGLAKW